MSVPLSIWDIPLHEPRRERPAGCPASQGDRPAGLVEKEAERRRIRARDQERLLPIVTALAARRGAEGITASEVITEAVLRGVLTGQETAVSQRALSWIGPWLAQLARRGTLAPLTRAGMVVRRRSDREASHGNLQVCYVAPQYAGGADG